MIVPASFAILTIALCVVAVCSRILVLYKIFARWTFETLSTRNFVLGLILSFSTNFTGTGTAGKESTGLAILARQNRSLVHVHSRRAIRARSVTGRIITWPATYLSLMYANKH
jgi:hypothetical protein